MDFCAGNTNVSASQMALSLSRSVDLQQPSRVDEMTSPSATASSPSKSPTCDQVQHYARQNQVGNVRLSGVSIVSLMIDGTERLCLAQISNTLLKDFSYNEIHNRRVALGITCVQCTPVQLEILRRAGAMPISSRRCGMITKREAERLVKSFLEDTAPLKLPDNFAFNVQHQCGWGCKGNFIPSRYNSSRAKCIKCSGCNIFFSPNKFIFHFHRTAESKYKHPDAANFNSWRRHIFLDYEDVPTELEHAWEDVKAMFNGGSRKRLMGSSSPGAEKANTRADMSVPKRPRMDFPTETPNMVKFPRLPYPYPVIPPVAANTIPNACPTGFIPRVPHPAFPFPNQGTAAEQPHFPQDPTKLAPNFADFWKTKGVNPYYNPLGILWAKNFGLYGDAAMQYGSAVDLSRQGTQKISQVEDANKYMHNEFLKLNGCFPSTLDSSKLQASMEHEKNKRNDVEKYMSAFRPVNKEGPFTLGDYKQLRLSSGSEEIDQDAMSPNTQSEHSDESGYELMMEEQAVCPDTEDADINVTDIEQSDSVSSPRDINKNDLLKNESQNIHSSAAEKKISESSANNRNVSRSK